MPEPIDINYARGESAEVVQLKFRRRAANFRVMTIFTAIIAFVIGGCWILSWQQTMFTDFWTGTPPDPPMRIQSHDGWINLLGTPRSTPLNVKWLDKYGNRVGFRGFHYREMGITFSRYSYIGTQKWKAGIQRRS